MDDDDSGSGHETSVLRDPSRLRAGVVRPPTALRPFAVFDRAGEQLGTFASWEVAHEWAHIAARQAGALLPVQVEDRAARATQFVDADGCERVTWAVAGRTAHCG